MNDRMRFDEHRLPNGVTCYFQKMDVEYTTIYLIVPVGTAHNVGPFLPGTAHFLEHICVERSRLCPELQQFKRMVGLYGGWVNATTYAFRTIYKVSVPTAQLEKVIPGFIAMALQPLFMECDLVLQRGVIANERRRRRWYPGDSELGQYLSTEWEWDQQYPLRQVFGDDEDLANMSEGNLYSAHQFYLDPRLTVIGIGSGNLKSLYQQLARVELSPRRLDYAYDQMRWVRKEYHERPFRDVNRYELRFGTFIQPPPPIEIERKLGFIWEYLINSVHGVLYRWLREKKGWVYELKLHISRSKHAYDLTLMFPLGNRNQVEIVRREWWDRCWRAMQDEKAILGEIVRKLGSSAYWYETVQKRIDSAADYLNDYGRIITVSEWKQMISDCKDTALLRELFLQYFPEDRFGSMCAIPEE